MSEEETTPFAKKTVYHSQLVSAGTIDVLITSEPTKSKYKRDGKDQYYISLKIQGKEHQYIIENESILQKLKGYKGHVVQLTALGSRGDAEMTIYDAAGPASNQAGNARAQQPPPAQGAAPPPAQGTSPMHSIKLTLLQLVNARILATEAAIMFTDFINGKHGDGTITEEHFQGAVSCFFIALDRKGLIEALPAQLPEKLFGEKKPEPPPPPPPPPPPEGPDESEIPF